VEVTPINVGDASGIERAVAGFARASNCGLIAVPGGGVAPHRRLIIALAARHKLPAVYYGRLSVTGGGLRRRELVRSHNVLLFDARSWGTYQPPTRLFCGPTHQPSLRCVTLLRSWH
jgi:hypothetical protein